MQYHRYITKHIRAIAGGVLFGLFCVCCSPRIVDAAAISIAPVATTAVGQRVSVDITLDPEGVSINSIESTLQFPKELLVFNGYSAKQSSIPLWAQEPKEIAPGVVHFAGVIPGGLERLYDPLDTHNRAVPIVRLYFLVQKAGDARLTLSQATVLQNDGVGTALPVTVGGTTIRTRESAAEESVGVPPDDTQPSPFTVTIVERSSFGRSPRLAVFAASDEEGAISWYEASIGGQSFTRVQSPLVLPYRLFSYMVTVRAYDFAGNMREQTVTVAGERPYGFGILIILLVVAIGVVRYTLYTKRRV